MVDRKVTVTATMDASGMIRGARETEAAVDRAGKSMQRAAGEAESAAKRQESAFSRMARSVQENERAWSTAGTALTTFGAVTTASLAGSAKAAVDWESSFAGVKKTVDDSAAGYAQLSSELRDMATTLPASHASIAGVAEAAGQLGIERENITSFTRTMIDLGETTNLSADQAATALARFANIMGTSQGEMSNLGSAIVELGNNYATTEAEIVEMGLRLAGAGRQAKLSEGEVLGLATALSSVGIEAQAGGTAFSRVIIEMGTAVDSQSAKLQTFASVAGMSAEEFSTAWRDNAGSAISAFVAGLGAMEASGQSIQPVLADLGMTDIRVGDALRRASAAADLFTGAMQTGNDAYQANTALAAEAAQRYETVASQLGVLKNNVVDAAISLGQVFLPAISALAGAGSDVLAWVADLPAPLQAIAGWTGAAAGGVSLLAGGFMLLAPRALETYRAFQQLGLIGPKTTGALRGIASFLTGPWGLALAGAGAAIGLFIAHQAKIKAEVDSARASLDAQTGAIGENTRAWAANMAESSGALQWASDLGLGAGVVTDALLGIPEAMAEVTAAADAASLAAVQHSDAWGGVDRQYATAADSGRRLVDLMNAKSGVVAAAVEQEARYRAELEATGRTTAQLAVESQRLAAQAEAYEASQAGAAAALEATRRELAAWSPAMERAAALGDEAADAYANWAGEMSGLAASFVDFTAGLGDSYEGINAYLSGLEEMIEAQINWAENMVLVSARVPSDVAEQLARLGPEAAPFIADLTTASEEEIQRTIEVFRQGGAEIPQAFAGNMADAGPVLRAAAARWGQDIADGIAVELAAGRTTIAEVVAEYDLATTINVQADPARFNETLNASIALGNESWAEPKIFGDADPFAAELGAALGMANKAEATSTLLGNTEPYVVALMGALAEANTSEGTAKIRGNPFEFFASLANAMHEANTSEATAKLDLNTWNAYTALRGFLSSIPSSVSIALRATPMGSVFGRLPGFMAGGYTGDVPTNQVAGFTHGQEFVSTAATTADPYNRTALEFMHSGRSIREWQPEVYARPAPVTSQRPASPSVYVENPWTGEYLEARVRTIAQGQAQRALAGTVRGAR